MLIHTYILTHICVRIRARIHLARAHVCMHLHLHAYMYMNNPFLTTLCFYVCVYEYTYLTSLPLHTPEPTTCVIGEVSQIIYDYLIWLSLQVDMVVKMITWSGFRSTHLGLSQPHPVDGWMDPFHLILFRLT